MATDTQPSAKSDVVSLNGKVDIYPNEPLSQYNCGPALAFKASVVKNSSQNYYALMCPLHLMQRLTEIEKYKGIQSENVAKLVYHGAALWPETNQEQFFLVYEDLGGHPLVPEDDKKEHDFNETIISKSIVPALVQILQSCKDEKFVHGSINAHNIFATATGSKDIKITLGDGLSCPVSYAQPLEYLTIPVLMAQKEGRGHLSLSDDIYAVGVTLAALLRSENPTKGMSEEDLIAHKIEHGSYATIMGKERVTGPLLELLRGVLHDDPKQRWTLDEIYLWLDGQRLSPKQAVKPLKAMRPIKFLDMSFTSPRLLALNFPKSRVEVEKLVDNNEMEQWLKRSLDNRAFFERYEKSIELAQNSGKGAGYQDRLVMHLSNAMDQNAPLRYKGYSMFPDGLTDCLFAMLSADEPANENQKNVFKDLLGTNLLISWINTRDDANVDYGPSIPKFDQLKLYLKYAKAGYGLERCLYELSNNARCLSPLLKNHYVHSAESMMRAFEDLAGRRKIPKTFFDVHSTAFLCAREPKVIERHVYDLGNGTDEQKLLATLEILAKIQSHMKGEYFPNIGQVFLRNQKHILSAYNDTQTVEKLSKKIKKAADSGNLVEIRDLILNTSKLKTDQREFEAAKEEYRRLSQELEVLNAELEKPKTFEIKNAKSIVAILACIIAGFAIATVAIISLTSGPMV
jgi:serine/threonine protein kinase